jgi:ResB-like family
MKAIHSWHRTSWGRAARFLGSINLAVPVLVFVAAALAWGTYLESAHNVKIARATVYGSWWFMGLMALTCVSLVFAVITRFPWKRKHIGFITVHAGLVALIAGGFWSLFGRVEGQLPLDAGTQSNILTTDTEQVELVRHLNGEFQPVDTAILEYGKNIITVGTTKLEVMGRWDNSRQEAFVSDDAEAPLRAVELTIDPPPMMPAAADSTWIGEESHGAPPTMEKGIRLRVLPAGQPFVNTQGPTSGYLFAAGVKEFALPAEGEEITLGWKVQTIKRFTHAMVTSAGLTEAGSGAENPAVEVVITDGNGSTEQHRAFLNFPDMVMGKPLAGEARSNLKLIARPQAAVGGETLAFYGTPPALSVAYVGTDNKVQEFESKGVSPQSPWTIKAGPHTVTITNQFTHAKANSRLVQAPKSGENRPALLVALPGHAGDDAIPLIWRQPTPLPIEPGPGQDPVMVRFGPRLVTLPFTIKLAKFHKRDYPGTEMAMSYESDVTVTKSDNSVVAQTISMNEPFKGEGWKVYQSGFVGSDVSIFSIMHDPGLPLTYIGCITLCIGIALTFYSRALSGGHPGIPALFGARKENGNGSHVQAVSAPDPEPAPAALVRGRADAREPELLAAR